MSLRKACLSLLIGATAWAAQSGSSPEQLLGRIKARMSQNLNRLPNYTCMMTTERERSGGREQRFEPIDRLRLEVALVAGKELFAWPGAGNFQDKRLTEMAPPGTIDDGNFGLHAYHIFVSSGLTFKYVGEEMRDGRRTVRFDYRVPYASSAYRINSPRRQIKVPYHGSLWADAKTLDLVRLEVNADDIPPDLEIAAASDIIEYGRVRIGGADFLLPKSSELSVTELSGEKNRNRTQFTGCRQFTTESSVSFGEEPVSGTTTARQSRLEINLPAGLPLELQLDTEIDSAKAFVFDPVTAHVSREVRQNGQVVVPKGALVAGRITRLERMFRPYSGFVVGLEFSTLEFQNSYAPLHMRLKELGPSLIGVGPTGNRRVVMDFPMVKEGVFEVLVAGHFQLPRDFRMVWITQLAPESARR